MVLTLPREHRLRHLGWFHPLRRHLRDFRQRFRRCRRRLLPDWMPIDKHGVKGVCPKPLGKKQVVKDVRLKLPIPIKDFEWPGYPPGEQCQHLTSLRLCLSDGTYFTRPSNLSIFLSTNWPRCTWLSLKHHLLPIVILNEPCCDLSRPFARKEFK